MKVVALKERAPNETRAAITPETARLFVKKGFSVCVEKNIGLKAGFTDEFYIEAGASVSGVPLEIVSDADIILKVQPSPLTDEINELSFAKRGAIVMGMLISSAYAKDYLTKLKEKDLTAVTMERIPRITKTQNMDVLSSQSNLAGYRAVIEAAGHYNRAIPMMMTSAGTISPAKVLVLGAGVAGLQAIATAKRLGASVFAYDVRSAAKEQVESLGGKFVMPDVPPDDLQDKSGYAREASEDLKRAQEELFTKILRNYDIVITTAQIPGKPAPRLISQNMIKTMRPGSIIVDMASQSGGNVEGSSNEQLVEVAGVKILGCSNLASHVAQDSSKLYAKNLYNLIDFTVVAGKFDLENDVIKDMLL